MTAEKHPLETVRKALQIYADRFKNARGSQIPANNALIALTTYMSQPQSCAECERLGMENADQCPTKEQLMERMNK